MAIEYLCHTDKSVYISINNNCKYVLFNKYSHVLFIFAFLAVVIR